MAEILYTFGQVEEVVPFNQYTSIASFSNYVVAQDAFNNSITSDIEKSFKFIQVVKDGTSVSAIINQYNDIVKNSNRYKKLLTLPIATVSIPTGNNFPTVISCLPLFGDIVKSPKVGQWIYIMGIPKATLGMSQEEGYIFYYIPNSYFLKTEDSFYSKTPDNADTGVNAQNILWPREGSSIFVNENGTSYIQLDNNDILLSSGYIDLASANKGVIETKYSEFKRFNSASQLDAFIFISKYNRIWEDLLFNYLKSLYEVSDNERINNYVQKLIGAKSFEERLKIIFNIDFSGRPAYEYAQSPEEKDIDNDKDSGIAIIGKNIYLGNTNSKVRYHSARGDRVYDLLAGIVKHLEDVNKLVKSHKHLGTPASVLTPDPPTVSTISQLDSSLAQIKNKLESILSPNIFIS